MDKATREKVQEQIEPIVAAVIKRIGLEDPQGLRVALRDAYPFGERLGYPYKAWLAEITRCIGGMRIKKPDPAQLSLFDNQA